MTSIDWKALKPHIPLPPGSSEYVERTDSAGDEIARWILADRSPLLLGGPAGSGKSTELARAAELLQPKRVACLIPLDLSENMRRLTPDRMRLRIVQKVGGLAQQVLHLPLSGSLKETLQQVNSILVGERGALDSTSGAILAATLNEITRLSRQGRLTLLIDGLEKVPPGPEGQDLFEALAAIREEVELVVVIPWHAAFGPQAETTLRAGERFIAVRALDIQGDTAEASRRVLRHMLLKRLGWPEEELQPPARSSIVDAAIRWSGGLPRIFLQLLADAGSWAKLRRMEPWPNTEDLNDACADQIGLFQRLLLPGDVRTLRAAPGTTGNEIELDRKIRLMAHGILLERVREGKRSLDVHPLAMAAFSGDQDA